jgi:histidinol phosphatase-like enzyme (inositol monophosphatase family)
MSPRLEFAVEAAHRAGRFTLSLFQTGTSVERKSDATPVTEADRGAEHMIREAISKAFPHDAILGEEQGGDHDTPDRWIIDPIDGTKSFVSGVPLYATLLSYEVNRVPVLGVAYFPALDEMLYAESGGGAFWNGRPCRVSAKSELAGSVVVCGGHGSMDNYGRSAGLSEIAKKTMATRTWSDAYGHALVATGRAEAMLDPVVSRWDISAVICIVREAGGTCSTFSAGDPLQPVHASGEFELVTSNGAAHLEVLSHFPS